jgi:hypothetical protein
VKNGRGLNIFSLKNQNEALQRKELANRTFYSEKANHAGTAGGPRKDKQVNDRARYHTIDDHQSVGSSVDGKSLSTTINNNNFIITINKNYN